MTTSAIQAAGGDYSTIAAWESATPVDSAEEWRGQLADETFSEQPTISVGGTTPVILEAQPGTSFNGTEGSGPVISASPAGTFGVINLASDDITIEGLELVYVPGGTAALVRRHGGSASSVHRIKRVLGHSSTGEVSTWFTAGVSGPDTLFENCLFYSCQSGEATDATCLIVNCTIIKTLVDSNTGTTGIRGGTAKNCYVAHFGPNSGHRDYLDTTLVTCASHDTSGSSGLQSLLTADVLEDPTAVGLDFRPIGAGALDRAGTGNTTDSDIPLVDIAGNPRRSSDPSIGAFEHVIADPDILLVLNDASGTTVVNDGTLADVSVGQGVEGVDWSWNTGLGSYDGYWESFTEGGSSQAWVDCSNLTFTSGLASESVAIAFNIHAFDTRGDSNGFLIGLSQGHPVNGGPSLVVNNPTTPGVGDFNLQCSFTTDGSQVDSHTFEDLSFNTDYVLSMSCDVRDSTVAQGRFKLDAGTVQKPATSNKQGQTLDTQGFYIGRGFSFSNYYGIDGIVYYIAYWRGYALTDAELAEVNSTPKTNIPLWPASTPSGALGASVAMSFGSSAGLVGKGQLDAQVLWDIALTADIGSTGDLAASPALTLTPTGGLTGKGAMEAADALVFTGTMDLEARGELESGIPLAFALQSDLNAGGVLESAVALVFGANASLGAQGGANLSATIPLSVTAAATLDALGSVESLVQMVFSESPQLSGRGQLDAAVAFALNLTANLAGLGALEALAQLTMAVVANVGGQGSGVLQATPVVTLGGQADIEGQGRLESVVALALSPTADPRPLGRMQASAPLVFTVDSDLTADGQLEAAVTFVLGALADLKGISPDDYLTIHLVGKTSTIVLTAKKGQIILNG